ncbi:MAG: sensor domain-containing diguanylate cyclase [Candidatus Moraniibacteriota bacterium]
MKRDKQIEPWEFTSPSNYQLLVETLEDHAIFMMDTDGHIATWNTGAEMQLGYTEKEMIGTHFSKIFTKEDIHLGIPAQELKIAKKKGRCRDDRKHVRKDGVELWVSGVVTAICDNGGHLRGYSKVLNDISARIEAEELIRHQAMHDTLTGLPNRKLMNDSFSETLKEAKKNSEQFAILFIDLDAFKKINDTKGHEMGDLLLAEIARRLAGSVRQEDMVARFGGDEFIIILKKVKAAEKIAQKISLSMISPVEINGKEMRVSISIGIALYPQDGKTARVLISAADKALYKAKECGGNGYKFYGKIREKKGVLSFAKSSVNNRIDKKK